MPLTALTLNSLIKWELTKTTAGFGDVVQSDPGIQFSLANIDLTKYNQLRADFYNIPVGGLFDFDLWSFTDLEDQLTGFTLQGVICVVIKPLVGNVGMGPSPSNGLQWPFQGAAQGLNLTAGGLYEFSLPATGPAQVVTALSRNIRLTNLDVVPATGYFIAVGG